MHIHKNLSFTVNKYGTVRCDFPALERIRDAVLERNMTATFLAELHSGKGLAGALYQLLEEKTTDAVNLCCYDILQFDRQDVRDMHLITRKEVLSDILPQPLISKCVLVNNEQEAKLVFDGMVEQGYEGAVIKSLDSNLMFGPCSWAKMKHKDQSDYEVIYIDPNQERIEIKVLIPRPGSAVSVGVKAVNKYKKHINVGELVTVEHQGVLSSGSLRHPVLIPKTEWR